MPHPTVCTAFSWCCCATGARRTEASQIMVEDIDSQRMADPSARARERRTAMCHSHRSCSRSCAAGGGGRSLQGYLFPAPRAIGVRTGLSPTRLSGTRAAVAATRAGLTKRSTPPLRLDYATHTLRGRRRPAAIQILMGHERLKIQQSTSSSRGVTFMQLSTRWNRSRSRGAGRQEAMSRPSRWPT